MLEKWETKYWSEYKRGRKTLTNLSRKVNVFFSNAIKAKKDLKHVWKNLKTISCQGSITTLKSPSMLNYKDKVIDGDINVANFFNEHFISISKLIYRTII